MYIRNISLILGFLAISACSASSQPSSEIAIDGFANDVSGDIDIVVAESYKTGPYITSVSANLSTNRGALILSEGDKLVAKIDGEEKDMGLWDTTTKFSWGIDSTYGDWFDGDRSGSTVTVALSRDGVEHSLSSVDLPLPIAMSAPAAGEIFSRDDSITLSWVPVNSTEKLGVFFLGKCDRPDGTSMSILDGLNHSVSAFDTGTLTIAVEDLYHVAFQRLGQTIARLPDGAICSTEIRMTRMKYQNSGFHSGTVTVKQYDDVTVTIIF